MNPHAQHERKDADVIGVAMTAAFLFLSIGITLLCVWGMLHVFGRQRNGREPQRVQVEEQRAEFPAPRLEANAGADLSRRRAADQMRLNSYGWMDRQAGVAHIPIERAMQLIVARGLPEVGGGQTRLQMMQARAAGTPPPNESATR